MAEEDVLMGKGVTSSVLGRGARITLVERVMCLGKIMKSR